MQASDGFPENIAVLAKTVFNCGFAYVRAGDMPEDALNAGDREALAVSHAFNKDAGAGCAVTYDAVYHPEFRDLPCVVGAPYIRFFAEYRTESPTVGMCSIYIADIAPRTVFSLREKDILKSLTQLVVEAAERRAGNGGTSDAVRAG